MRQRQASYLMMRITSFSRFAAMIRSDLVRPLIGGATRFQPVFVGGMAAGLMEFSNAPIRLLRPTNLKVRGIYSFKALSELPLTALDRQRILRPIPFALAQTQGGLLELLSNPPLTRDRHAVENRPNG
jgi:uncharacterized protein YbjT (DUF2867 family)